MGILLSYMSEKMFGPERAKIAMLGLDAAGKTTIMYKLKLNELVTTIPTVGFNVEEITFHNLIMTVWDVGGQKIIRYVLENLATRKGSFNPKMAFDLKIIKK